MHAQRHLGESGQAILDALRVLHVVMQYARERSRRYDGPGEREEEDTHLSKQAAADKHER